jgi:hypothetical protein
MANRPCRPDADLKRLWQTLLPGLAMPACGVAEEKINIGEDAERDKASPPRRLAT